MMLVVIILGREGKCKHKERFIKQFKTERVDIDVDTGVVRGSVLQTFIQNPYVLVTKSKLSRLTDSNI